jgi:hypothetical protein
MRTRYSEYFLSHVLLLEDGFSTYYVQAPHSADLPAPGIALKGLEGHRHATDWLKSCIGGAPFYDDETTNMRWFLSNEAPFIYPLHRMDDDEVINETAKIIMDYRYPIVVKPAFEPPGLQSDLADHMFDARNGSLQYLPEIQKLFRTQKSEAQDTPDTRQQSKGFQFKDLKRGHYPEAPLDGDVISNILNLPSALSASIANDVIDFTNAVLEEAQAMQNKGGLEYLHDASTTQWQANLDWFRRVGDIARKGPNQLLGYLAGDFGNDVEETVRTGPNRLLGYVTGNDMWSDIGTAFSVENWKNAFNLKNASAMLSFR